MAGVAAGRSLAPCRLPPAAGPAGAAAVAAAGLAAGLFVPLPAVGVAWTFEAVVAAAVAVSAAGAALLTPTPVSRSPGGGPTSPASAPALLLTAGVALRTSLALLLGAGVLGLLGAADGYRPAVAWSALGLAAGLAGGVALRPGLRVLWATEPLGWVLGLGVVAWAPSLGTTSAAALVAAAACLGGVALLPALRRGGAPALLAALVALPLSAPVWRAVAAGWAPAEALRLALGVGEAAAGDLAQAVAEGDARLRFRGGGLRSAAVLDVAEAGGLRLLTLDGEAAGALPTTLRSPRSRPLLAPPAAGAALALLAAPSPPDQVAVVGLGTGVAAGVALACPTVERLALVEPHAALVAAHQDPGDLFGFADGHLFGAAPDRQVDPRLLLHEEPTWSFLRRGGAFPAVIIDRSPPPPRLLALARARGGAVTWRVPLGEGAPDLHAALRAARAVFPRVWVFWPEATGGLVLLAGVEELDLAQLAARWEAWPELRRLLRRSLGATSPAALLGACIASPAAVERFLAGDEAATAQALARVGAREPLAAFAGLDAGQAELLAGMARVAGRRELPAALGWARAAVDLDRTAETLHALGERSYGAGLEEDALRAWSEALELEAGHVASRVALARHHLAEDRLGVAQNLLRAGLSGDRDRDAPLHYELAVMAEQVGWPAAAAEAFGLAGDYRDAPARAAALQERARTATAGVPAAQKLEAAELLLQRARTTPDPAEAARLRQDGLAALLGLARGEAALEARERRALARLLERCAETEPAAPVREHLFRLEAEVLEPLTAEPRAAIQRARALIRGGVPEAAERSLRALIAREGARAPRAHLALGEALAAQGRTDEAIAALERGLTQAPPTSLDVGAYELLADLHGDAGQGEAALRALRAAEGLVPGIPRVRLRLARLLLELERPAEARAALRAYLDVAPPGDPGRVEAAQHLRRLEDR